MSKTISVEQLRQILAQQRGPSFVTFTARTSARARKTGNRHWPVTKLARVNGVIGFSYGRAVRNQQLREGRPAGEATFKPRPRAWGNRADPPAATPRLAVSDHRPRRRRGLCPLMHHKGRYYLDTKVERVLEVRYFDRRGRELEPDKVKDFLPVRDSKRAARQQGVKRAIVLRSYPLASIEAITINGISYAVLGEG